MCQLVPSHRSASVNGPELVRCSPTAVQAWALHATPLKKFSAPESFGVGWMRHAVPSHRSASVPASEPPTAVHAEDDVQDTAERPAPAAGLGVRWMRQRVPFHRSASVPIGLPEASVRAPTAVQTEGDVHATPLRKPPGDEGAGTGWIRHFVPFHRSAKTPTGVPELLKEFPVAVQADDDVQDKPNRALPCAPGGLGVGWRRHREPSHRSASVPVKSPELSVRAPTAAQATADVQDTLARPPPARRLGVGWMRHFAPSHRSASGRFAASPVAVQADGDVQDTLSNVLGAAPLGLGVGWMRHRLPSHRSAKVRRMPDLPTENPAAVQAEAAVQSTPIRRLSPPARLGVGWIRHRLPSHRSAKVRRMPDLPTEADGHATVFRTTNCAPAGLGVGWMRHRVPSHRSASVLPAFDLPAAVHDDGDVQATLARPPPPCGGLGVGWMRHRVPSHRSARGWNAPARVMLAPTAVHADGAVQETPDRELTATPRGLGVGWMRHVLPFHRSARVTPTPEALTYVPTAVHEVAPVQDSQNSWPVGTLGFGLGVIDQPAPEAPAGAARVPTRSTAATSKMDLFIANPSPSAGA